MKRHVPSTYERYESIMVLGAVGDTLGYNNGKWEFQTDGVRIHKELEELGGLPHLSTKGRKISDDTVMHIATAKALLEYQKAEPGDKMYRVIARQYLDCLKDMEGRSPGKTCIKSIQKLQPDKSDGFVIPFDPKGGGCGGAMRSLLFLFFSFSLFLSFSLSLFFSFSLSLFLSFSLSLFLSFFSFFNFFLINTYRSMCIGMRYPNKNQMDKLIAVAIESGRLSHNHPSNKTKRNKTNKKQKAKKTKLKNKITNNKKKQLDI